MNELEEALTDVSNGQLDFYLENQPTAQIRADIEDIKNKSIVSTTCGRLKADIQKILDLA